MLSVVNWSTKLETCGQLMKLLMAHSCLEGGSEIQLSLVHQTRAKSLLADLLLDSKTSFR